MEIVKQLNLNGNPQVVPNGSLMYAKNIKLSDDGTYITNDDGLDLAFASVEPYKSNLKVSTVVGTFCSSIVEHSISGDGQCIVGYINCPNEIVLFVHKKYGYIDPETQEEVEVDKSEIYRAIELKHDYTVQIEGINQTITSDKLALYKVPNTWKYDNGKIIGTYTYNVYNHLIVAIAESDSYTIEIDSETQQEIQIPFDKQLMTIDLNDSSETDPIDKYSCAPNIPIANLSLINKVKGKPIPRGIYYFFIRYEISDKVYTNWFPVGASQFALSLDYKTLFNHTYTDGPGEGSANYHTYISKIVNTNKDSFYNFNFILTLNDTYNYIGFQIAYILQTDDTFVGRIWNNFVLSNKELSKNILFNGGYIDEVDVEDLTRNVLNFYNVKALTNYDSKLYIANFKETEYNVDLLSYAKKIDTYLIKKAVDFNEVEKQSDTLITWTYKLKNPSNNSFTTCTVTVPENITEIKLSDIDNLITALNGVIVWHISGDHNISDYLGTDATIVLSENLLIIKPASNAIAEWRYYDDYRYDISSGMMLYGHYYYDHVEISKSKAITYYGTSNTDNVIRSLMPFEVYSFYVHYVRKDGSYTNGILLENKVNYDIDNTKPTLEELATKISNIDSSRLQTFNIDDIATISEIADKYLYEVYFNENDYGKGYFDLYLDSNGNKLFKAGNASYSDDNNSKTKLARLGVQFTSIEIPQGYIGAFFSYASINSLAVYQGYVAEHVSGNNILIKSNDAELALSRYDGIMFIPHHTDSFSLSSTEFYYISDAAPILSNSKTNIANISIDNTGKHGGILMHLDEKLNISAVPAIGTVGSIILFNNSIYSNEDKELISLGPISYIKEGQSTNTIEYGEKTNVPFRNRLSIIDTEINYDINYPSFLCKDKILLYKDKLLPDEKLSMRIIAANVVGSSKYSNDNYAEVKDVWKFSNYNLLALSFKKEPEEAAGADKNDNTTINTLVKPINASDLFKLESCYIPDIYKAYTNYNKRIETLKVFTNVIRCSYPIRNESGINSWRWFNPNNYYVIDNSNGEIVNIFGASSSFYIHTKNNLLVTSSNAKLEANNTEININNNNIFDVDPKEIFTSDLGYGGIKYQECQLFSQFGYIWYDTERYKLFRFDNGQLIDINSGIDEIIKKYKFEKCYINIDNENNRIFFAFVEGNGGYITLGYDTLGNKWLSLYDFTFNKAIHTANCAIFGIDLEAFLYKYSKGSTICDYKSLARYNDDLPFYGTQQVGSYPIIQYCCFDIIFNASYTTPKVLDSISWIHEYITRNTLDNNHPAELKIINRTIANKIDDLTGLIIDIYSDSVDSGLLNVTPSSGDKLNDVANPNSYKYPYYNKGIWNYSFFRNNITTPVTNTELEALAQAYGVNVNTLKNVYKITDKNGNQLYVDGNPAYTSSDLRSLIYGKYIAVRFIFKTVNKLKFDNLVFNLQKY